MNFFSEIVDRLGGRPWQASVDLSSASKTVVRCHDVFAPLGQTAPGQQNRPKTLLVLLAYKYQVLASAANVGFDLGWASNQGASFLGSPAPGVAVTNIFERVQSRAAETLIWGGPCLFWGMPGQDSFTVRGGPVSAENTQPDDLVCNLTGTKPSAGSWLWLLGAVVDATVFFRIGLGRISVPTSTTGGGTASPQGGNPLIDYGTDRSPLIQNYPTPQNVTP